MRYDDPFWNYNPRLEPRTIVPVLVQAVRVPHSLSWVITAVRHKPSDAFLSAFDEVHRMVYGSAMYWIAVRGGTLSKDAVWGLVTSHAARNGWEEIDLRHLD